MGSITFDQPSIGGVNDPKPALAVVNAGTGDAVYGENAQGIGFNGQGVVGVQGTGLAAGEAIGVSGTVIEDFNILGTPKQEPADAAEKWVGVQGSTQNGTAVRGVSIAGPGVVGRSQFGVGLTGESEKGIGLYATGAEAAANLAGKVFVAGDIAQLLPYFGAVKTLLHLHGKKGTITRAFSSEPGMKAPTCYRLDAGLYSLDLHYQVGNRYVTATPVAGNYADGSNPNPYAPAWYPPPSGSVTQEQFIIANVVFDGFTAPPSYSSGDPGTRAPATTMITLICVQPVFQKEASGLLGFLGFQLQDCDLSIAVF